MKRAATYLRVSRSDQSTNLQRDETTSLISRRGWELVEEFSDDGISGATNQRPAFRAMLAAAKRRRFDALVVYKTDRLFRSLHELVATLADLETWGIAFVSVTEPFDTSSASGRLLVQLVGAFAEFERSVMIERTKSGLEAARRRGVHVGRPRSSVDPELVRVLRSRGRTLEQIATELRVGKGTVHRLLSELAAVART